MSMQLPSEVENTLISYTNSTSRSQNQKYSGNNGNSSQPPAHSPSICVMRNRISSLEDNDTSILNELTKINEDVDVIKRTLGEIPDPIAGTPGSGMSALLTKIANTMIQRQAGKSYHDIDIRNSLVDAIDSSDEGETTKIQDRAELIVRAKVAEAEAKSIAREYQEHKNSIRDNKAAIVETGKLKIEKWKVVLGFLGLVFSTKIVDVLLSYVTKMF